MATGPFVSTILHASDFSEASDRAFAHALTVALAREAEFTLFHAGADPADRDWTQFPPIRKTLERWGVLEPGSPKSALMKELSVKARKIVAATDDAAGAILQFIDEERPELLVLATEAREGLPRWLHRSVAERVARESRTMTLFVPAEARGFVSVEDGSVDLRKIVLPVDESPNPRGAIARAASAAEVFGEQSCEIVLLHIGADAPPLRDLPELPGVSWTPSSREGDVVEEILAAAEEEQADLLVMATAGHDGVLDALRGSVTERVLRGAPCPLLAVPAT